MLGIDIKTELRINRERLAWVEERIQLNLEQLARIALRLEAAGSLAERRRLLAWRGRLRSQLEGDRTRRAVIAKRIEALEAGHRFEPRPISSHEASKARWQRSHR